MTARYVVTLTRTDDDRPPIITSFNPGKATYEKVAEVLYKAQRGKRQR
jgi:hypothetical protein